MHIGKWRVTLKPRGRIEGYLYPAGRACACARVPSRMIVIVIVIVIVIIVMIIIIIMITIVILIREGLLLLRKLLLLLLLLLRLLHNCSSAWRQASYTKPQAAAVATPARRSRNSGTTCEYVVCGR